MLFSSAFLINLVRYLREEVNYSDTGEEDNIMIRLNEDDFDKVNGLLTKGKVIPTFAYSVLNHYIRGAVYADSSTPKTVLIGTDSGVYFVVGEVNNQDFNDFLLKLYDQRKKINARFTLFSSNGNWDCVIESQFKDKLRQMSRYAFHYDGKKRLDNKELAKEYSLRRINEELLVNSSEFNEDYYKEYWGTVSNFCKNGFGYCILHNGEVVSECTSIFSSLHYSEMDIATHKEYRGKGLASIIAIAFVDHCLENNKIPRWDCDIDNKSSIKLAGKLGFVNPVQYNIYL